MFAYIKGTVARVGADFAVIEVMGIGYTVNITKTAASRLKISMDVQIHTVMNVSQDNVSLFGFLDTEELEMFNMLTSVPGVGPKAAVSLLDSFTPADITQAILTDDYDRLTKAQGIGKKTAQMLTLRLKDKLGGLAVKAQAAAFVEDSGVKADATEALTALGYSRSEALRAVLETALPDMTAQQIIRAALRKLSR